MNTTVLAERLRAQFPDGLVDIAQPRGELTLDVAPDAWHATCRTLRDGFGFEQCMVRACQRIARFYFKESCGQCTPCREGTGWMYRMRLGWKVFIPITLAWIFFTAVAAYNNWFVLGA